MKNHGSWDLSNLSFHSKYKNRTHSGGAIRFFFPLIIVALLFAASGERAVSGTFNAVPSSAAFGDVPVGTRNTRIIQLQNELGMNVLISSITATGSGFSVSGINTPMILRAGVTVQFTVTFLPAVAGSVTGTITVTESGGIRLVSVPLSGTGEPSSKVLDVTPSSVAFGIVDVNTTSITDVSLKNGGNSNLYVSGVSITGTGLSETGVSNGTTIEPGQTATIKAEFAPKSTGTVSGAITITSNATSGTSIKIPVSATGVAVSTSTTHTVDLHWNASSTSGVTGYHVYRGIISGGPYTRLDSSPVTATNYADNDVSAGTYYYVVTSVDGSAVSEYSNPVSVTVP